MNKNDITKIEKTIGYKFVKKTLLRQAFIRKSYSKENGGENNEVLEFIGDKVLDFKVVELLAKKYGEVNYEDEYENNYSEGKLTELKKRLVEKKMLASRIDSLGLADYLIMGNGDIEQNASESPSVKEDLFEAIIGAVAVDCNYDFKKITEVVDLMLDPNYYLDNDFDDSDNYVSLIQEWSLKENGDLPDYDYSNYFNSWNCNLKLFINGYTKSFSCNGKSKSEARMMAAKKAYDYLEENDLFFTIKDEIENPSYEMAINQLQELAQKGYISFPDYKFEELQDKDGSPLWKCSCIVSERPKYWYATSNSKKNAKKSAAWGMLKDILDIEE